MKNNNLSNLKLSLKKSISSNSLLTDKVLIFFSGGIDSSLIAFLVSKKIKKTFLLCVGLSGCFDFYQSEKVASLLNLPLIKHEIPESNLSFLLSKTLSLVDKKDFVSVSFALPFFVACEQAKNLGFKKVFSGHGADALFCGFDYFSKLAIELKPSELELRRKLIVNDFINSLHSNEMKIAKHFDLELITPFSSDLVIKSGLAFSAKQCLAHKLKKAPLRKLAGELGLPSEIVNQKKKAFQYGTNIANKLKKIF